jgi:signal transduction histidine kinase
MKSDEQKTEWLFINLRWFLLLAVATVIGVDVVLSETPFPPVALVLLVVGGVGNLTALIVLLQNNTSRAIRNAFLLHDVLLTLGFMASTQGLRSQLLFISLVPITTAALRLSWPASIFVTTGVVGTYWLLSWHDAGFVLRGDLHLIFFGIVPQLTNGIVLAVAGLSAGRVADRIKQSLLAERDQREEESNHALRIARQRASLIFELASTLSATLNYERVLEAALDISNVGLKEFFQETRDLSQVGMILLFGMDETLYVAKARGLAPREEDLRFAASRGLLATAIRRTDPVVINNPAEDPELNRVMRIRNCEQAIAIPLRAGYESYGLLVLASTEPGVYTSDFRDLLIAICNQAVLALQNASLYQNLMEEKDRLVTVEEDARKKLARDLHDGPTQTIAAIAMRLNYIRLLVEDSPSEAATELLQLEELARRTTKEIRQMLFTLRPLILESQGLVAALEQLRQKMSETGTLPIHLEVDRQVDRLLSKDAKGAIFYIVEEATTNARKHAQAQNIWIQIYQRGMNVVAEIEDDGIGFDVAALEVDYASRDSLGMINLRERAVLVKGRTVISSTLGDGTKVTVTVPADVPQPLETQAKSS